MSIYRYSFGLREHGDDFTSWHTKFFSCNNDQAAINEVKEYTKWVCRKMSSEAVSVILERGKRRLIPKTRENDKKMLFVSVKKIEFEF